MVKLLIWTSTFIIMYIVKVGAMFEIIDLDSYIATDDTVIRLGSYKNSSFVLKGFTPPTYELKNNTNISIKIDIHDNDGIVVHIAYLNVIAGCDVGEYIKISSQNKSVTLCQRIFNPNADPGSQIFHGHTVNISYITPSKITTLMQLIITGFTQAPCSSDDLFRCNNGICIFKGLLCNKMNNCGDGSDEESIEGNSNCKTHSFDEMTNFIPLFIALPLLLLTVTLVLYCCVRRQSNDSPFDPGEVVYVYEGDDSGTDDVQSSGRTTPKTDKGNSASIQDSVEMYHMKSRYSDSDSPKGGKSHPKTSSLNTEKKSND